MKIVLLGYMGSGKSTIGNELSKKLSFSFKDLDKEIEISEGKTIPNIFSEKGEIYFRKIENIKIKNLIETSDDIVLATGGGTPCYGDTMDYLLSCKDVITVYLKSSLEVLTERLFLEKDERPLITHIKEKEALNDFIRKHLFEQGFVYSRSNFIIDVSDLSIREVVKKINDALF